MIAETPIHGTLRGKLHPVGETMHRLYGYSHRNIEHTAVIRSILVVNVEGMAFIRRVAEILGDIGYVESCRTTIDGAIPDLGHCWYFSEAHGWVKEWLFRMEVLRLKGVPAELTAAMMEPFKLPTESTL